MTWTNKKGDLSTDQGWRISGLAPLNPADIWQLWGGNQAVDFVGMHGFGSRDFSQVTSTVPTKNQCIGSNFNNKVSMIIGRSLYQWSATYRKHIKYQWSIDIITIITPFHQHFPVILQTKISIWSTYHPALAADQWSAPVFGQLDDMPRFSVEIHFRPEEAAWMVWGWSWLKLQSGWLLLVSLSLLSGVQGVSFLPTFFYYLVFWVEIFLQSHILNGLWRRATTVICKRDGSTNAPLFASSWCSLSRPSACHRFFIPAL